MGSTKETVSSKLKQNKSCRASQIEEELTTRDVAQPTKRLQSKSKTTRMRRCWGYVEEDVNLTRNVNDNKAAYSAAHD